MAKFKHGNCTHGLTKHPLYKVWAGMKQRCYNRKDQRYKDYGGRGITVCKEWIHDAQIFIEWAINEGWKNNSIIDRKDNDGNYNSENVRFVDGLLSRRNTRILSKRNTSGYRGVSFHKPRNKYRASISIGNKKKYIGLFSDPFHAAIAYDLIVLLLDDGRPTNLQWRGSYYI